MRITYTFRSSFKYGANLKLVNIILMNYRPSVGFISLCGLIKLKLVRANLRGDYKGPDNTFIRAIIRL